MPDTTPTGPSLNLTLGTPAKKIPNQPPSVAVDYRIALIGEAPGETEHEFGQPFVGKSGRLFNGLLSTVGILRHGSFVGNICQVRPPGNEIGRFRWEGAEIQSGLATLKNELQEFQPNICVLMGNTTLRAAKGEGYKISEWRGTLFRCEILNSPFFGYKCIATYHPAYVLRDWSQMPLLKVDLQRAFNEAYSSELLLPERHIRINLTTDEIIERLEAIREGDTISPDIEGGLGGWTLIGIATSPTEAFVIDWNALSETDEIRVGQALSKVMWNDKIYKILQNGLYDNFVMAYGFRILIRGVRHDTMVKGWEIYPELPKSLGVQASIWTKEPFYKVSHSKQARAQRANDPLEWIRYREYCGTDCCVTYEISNAQDNVLRGDALKHYRFNMDMLDPILYMELRGIRYDIQGASEAMGEVALELSQLHSNLLVRTGGLDLTGKKGSISSTKLPKFLYGQMGFPPQYKKEHGRKTDKVTTDVEALLNLVRKHDHPILHDILRIRRLEGWKETLEIGTDPDGRVRASYSNVGTETGRFNCKTSPTGSGANLTTITKKYRRLYLADDGYDLGQFDLSGADGWTVACRCAALGDDTMLEDYRYGIKPAKVIALMYKLGPEVGKWSRDALLNEGEKLDEEGWLYFSCKRVQHGTNYLMRKNTMSIQIMKDSYKYTGEAIYVEPNQCERLQYLYQHGRYQGINRWHEWARGEFLKPTDLQLKSASGHTRTFFGRKKSMGKIDEQTLKEFVADEPQENTTYTTNLAMLRLWQDPDNRRENGSLIIEPLHQVHDAALVQWPSTERQWALRKMKEYFNNELDIVGIKIVIPTGGGWGPSWGEAKNSLAV